MIRQKLLEKALNDACTYIHDDGYNGSHSDPFYEEYKKKSIKCWREYFLKGDN